MASITFLYKIKKGLFECVNTGARSYINRQPRTQACSRYPSDQRRLGTERDSARPS